MASSKYCADSIENVLSLNFPTRVIYIGVDENSMTIKVQWDSDKNHMIDTCFNFNFDKIN